MDRSRKMPTIRTNEAPEAARGMVGYSDELKRVGEVGEQLIISRRRMERLFRCSIEVSSVLDRFMVAPHEGCYVRSFVEQLWRLKK